MSAATTVKRGRHVVSDYSRVADVVQNLLEKYFSELDGYEERLSGTFSLGLLFGNVCYNFMKLHRAPIKYVNDSTPSPLRVCTAFDVCEGSTKHHYKQHFGGT